jgi:hypothetical protein
MPFETMIAAFATALADPAAPPPAATRGRLGAPDARRFSVYRNNVAVGLIGALEARFPVSRRIVGDDAFRVMARAFARARKPSSPVMIAYGQDFPEFAADFLASAEAPELLCLVEVARDVARLENAWVEAYHAEDASVATAGELRDLGPDQLAGTRIEFHPAARLLRFTTPAASIWAASQSCDGPAAPNRSIGEDALITRPGCDVSVRILPPLAYDFASRLREGATLIEAALAVDDPEFDFGTHLVGLVESGAAASILAGSAS